VLKITLFGSNMRCTSVRWVPSLHCNCWAGTHPGGLFGCHDKPLCTTGTQH